MHEQTPDISRSQFGQLLMESERRFGGLQRLYGIGGAQRLRQAHVAVIGLGGVGSWAAEALARSGVGQLSLVDLDHVAESNINRQVLALESTLGQAKVIAMQERITQINPDCEVRIVEEFVAPDNWPALLPKGVNAVIDACDQVKAKVAMAAWAMEQGEVFITVGAAGGKFLAQWVDIADLAVSTHDPLLAQVRYQLRKQHAAPRAGKAMGVACVYSREPVHPPDASCEVQSDGSLNCSGFGSMVSVTATFGMCAAGWVINRLAQTS